MAAVLVQQPGLRHRTRHEEEIECADCHAQAEVGLHASIPGVRTCMLCHEEPLGSHPDEPRVRECLENGEGTPWAQANRLPGHTIFSHAAHVVDAGMECADFHGALHALDDPVTVTHIGNLTMEACMQCHEERGSS